MKRQEELEGREGEMPLSMAEQGDGSQKQGGRKNGPGFKNSELLPCGMICPPQLGMERS